MPELDALRKALEAYDKGTGAAVEVVDAARALCAAPQPPTPSEDRRDAERYRAWRAAFTKHARDGDDLEGLCLSLADAWSEDEVDAAIDAARTTSSTTGGAE